MLSTLRMKNVELFQTNPQRMDKLNFGYSSKNISIVTDRQYKAKLVEKKEAAMKENRNSMENILFWTEWYTQQY